MDNDKQFEFPEWVAFLSMLAVAAAVGSLAALMFDLIVTGKLW